jgi:hypothetical protein
MFRRVILVAGLAAGCFSASGTESPIIITIVRKGDGYAGSTNGLNASSESALKRVTVEAADDSKLGAVSLTADLTAGGNTLKAPAPCRSARRSSTSRSRCSDGRA